MYTFGERSHDEGDISTPFLRLSVDVFLFKYLTHCYFARLTRRYIITSTLKRHRHYHIWQTVHTFVSAASVRWRTLAEKVYYKPIIYAMNGSYKYSSPLDSGSVMLICVRPQHAATKLACLALSSVRFCPCSIRQCRLPPLGCQMLLPFVVVQGSLVRYIRGCGIITISTILSTHNGTFIYNLFC